MLITMVVVGDDRDYDGDDDDGGRDGDDDYEWLRSIQIGEQLLTQGRHS